MDNQTNNNSQTNQSSERLLLKSINEVIEVQNRFLSLCDQMSEAIEMLDRPVPKRREKWWKRLFKRNRHSLLILALLLLAGVSCSRPAKAKWSQEEKRDADSVVFANRNIDSLKIILKRYTDQGNKIGEIAASKELGKCYREASRFTEAIDCHRLSAGIASEIKDTLELIQALNNIGTNFRRMGILDEAASYHYQAFELSEKIGDRTRPAVIKNRVVSLNGIGNVQMTLGNTEAADSAFRMALAGERQLKSPLGQAINYANLGSIFESNGQLDSAWAYYENSMIFNKEAESSLGVSLCHTHFGELYEKRNLYDDAIKEYNEAYKIMEKSSDRWHWLESCLALSRVNILKKDFSSARFYLDKAMKTAQEIGALEYVAEVYHQRYLLSSAQGDCSGALQNYVLSNTYADSVTSAEKINHMQNIRVKYERDHWQSETNVARQNYQTAKRAKNTFLVTMILISLLLMTVIAALWYALRMRSQKQAVMRKMEQVRSNFFTNITHEFRTPLTIILGLGQQLKDGSLPEDESVENIGTMITRQGGKLLSLINQLLDISKIRSAIGEPDYRSGNIVSYLRMITESYHEYAREKRIELTYVPNQTEIQMDFVPDYIQKVMSNLLSNALKFTPEFGNIYITSQLVDENVVIRVADTGCGIAREDIGHIFDAFYQGNNSRAEIGTGVGLSLVHQIVEAMNGSIKVNSGEGKGSVFTIVLPLRHGYRKWEAFNPEAENLKTVDGYTSDNQSLLKDGDVKDGSKPVLLIVEDNSDVAYYIGSQLKSNYNLFYARNGEEGLEKASELMPDLIVTDVMMPGIDGYELCRSIRATDLLSHIPIIVISARSTEEDRIEGISAGADAFLFKPFNSEELNIRVEKLLESRQELRRKYSKALENGTERNVKLKPCDQDFLNKLVDVVYARIETGDFDSEAISNAMCLSRTQLNRKVLSITGQNTTGYILLVRIGKAKRLLDSDPDLPIGDVASKCGFDDVAYFSRLFKRFSGMTPSQYKKRIK